MTELESLAIISNVMIAGMMHGSAILNFEFHSPLKIYLTWLIASGIIAFGFYGYDKCKAVRGGYRVPENHLHFLTLSGGFLGSALGMAVFQHKIRKTSFKVVLVSAFFIHALILLFILRF